MKKALLVVPLLLGFTVVTTSTTTQAGGHGHGSKDCAEAQKMYEASPVKIPMGENDAIVLKHNHSFCPAHITVKKGTTIHFVSVDKDPHLVAFKTTDMRSATHTNTHEIWSAKMTEVGDFPYHCEEHAETKGMHGKVTVTE